MNEIIIKEPMFVSPQVHAYRKYVEVARTYTTPLTFQQWYKQLNEVVLGCA